MIVHDIRNPLTTILAGAGLLVELSRLGSVGRVTAEQIGNQSRRIRALLENLLVLAKSEAGKLTLDRRPTDLPALLARCASESELLARLKELRIEFQPPSPPVPTPPLVALDADLLIRVVDNLLSNAVKNAPKHSRIQMDLSWLTNPDAPTSGFRLRVCDEGPGIEPEVRATLFQCFSATTSDYAQAQKSIGLGLAFCKVAVEAHGGTIRLEDGGPGTTFRVEIPPAPQGGVSLHRPAGSNGRQPTP